MAVCRSDGLSVYLSVCTAACPTQHTFIPYMYIGRCTYVRGVVTLKCQSTNISTNIFPMKKLTSAFQNEIFPDRFALLRAFYLLAVITGGASRRDGEGAAFETLILKFF